MRTTIVGATGVLGRHVIPRLLERGHEVRAVVRTRGQADALQRTGVQAFVGDLLDRESLAQAVKGADNVLHLATAIPKDRGGDWTMNDRIRREGTANLLHWAKECGATRYVQQSIIMLYGSPGQRIVDESEPLRPQPYIRSAFDMEQLVQESGMGWCILRGGHFYGLGTGAEDGWREQARTDSLRFPGDGGALISLVHVIDMARAVVMCAEGARPDSIYNVVDDRPVSRRDLFMHVAHQEGAPDPLPDATDLPSLGCSNERIKRDLGWQPTFPSFRSGLVR